MGIRAEVFIDFSERSLSKAFFDNLKRSQPSIEADFGEPLSWERLDERSAARIAVYRPGTIDEVGTLDEIQRWAIEKPLKLKVVFGPRLAEAARD